MQQRNAELNKQLDAFTQLVSDIIEKLWQAGQIRHELEPVRKMVIDDFTYNENGPAYTGSSHPVVYEENWMRAAFTLGETVFKLPEYLAIQELIVTRYPDPNGTHRFQQYVFQLFTFLLRNRLKPAPQEYEDFKNKLIAEIDLKPHRCRATVNLFGIILESPEILIAAGVKLRQTSKTDLETPSKLGSDLMLASSPSAILAIEIALKANQHGVLQQQIGHYVKLIRLFDLGSVSYNSYRLAFDAISGPGMESGSGEQHIHPWKVYRLPKSKEAAFVHFLTVLPQQPGYRQFEKAANHLTTAFDRFSEALLERVAIERKIANAVMAVEALLSNDNVELKFRMQTRVAKIMTAFGFAPLTVRLQLQKAYDIRSTFAHGGYLAKEDKTKLEKLVGPLDDFATQVINYVRILIITELSIDFTKSQLITLVDDALIDNTSNDQLNLKLEAAKPFL
jgi:hypothetical protein